MPLGASRLNFLAKGAAVEEAGEPGLAAIDPNASAWVGAINGVSTKPGSSGDTLTVSLWVKDANTGTNQVCFTLIEQGSGYAGGSGILDDFLSVEYAGGRFRIISSQNVTGSTGDFSFDYLYGTYNAGGAGTFSTGGWNHFVFSCNFSGSALSKCYINGQSASSVKSTNGGRESTSVDPARFNMYDAVMIGTQWNGAEGPTDGLAQVFIDNNYYDLDTAATLAKFVRYDSNDSGGAYYAVDMGDEGWASGLTRPLIFHNGGTSDFATKGGNTGSYDYTNTFNNSGSASDIATSSGPQF